MVAWEREVAPEGSAHFTLLAFVSCLTASEASGHTEKCLLVQTLLILFVNELYSSSFQKTSTYNAALTILTHLLEKS